MIDIEKIEQDLVAAIETAKADGVKLISGDFGAYINVVGGAFKFENPDEPCACLVGVLAYADRDNLCGDSLIGHFKRKYTNTKVDGLSYHWALIDGFDGGLEREFYKDHPALDALYHLGARLRERYLPDGASK